MSLIQQFTESAFDHGRTCKFDKQGNALIHDAPTPWGEDFKYLMRYINSLKWEARGKKGT